MEIIKINLPTNSFNCDWKFFSKKKKMMEKSLTFMDDLKLLHGLID